MWGGLLVNTLSSTIINSQKNNSYTTNINEYENTLVNKNSKQSKSSTTGDFNIKSNGGYNLPNNYQPRNIDFVGNNDYSIRDNNYTTCTSPYGVALATDTSIILIDPYTNELKWEVKNKDGSLRNIGLQVNQILYDEQSEHFVIYDKGSSSSKDDNLRTTKKVLLVNAKTGIVTSETIVDKYQNGAFLSRENIMFPVKNSDGSFSNSYIFTSNAITRVIEKQNLTFLFTVSEDGTSISVKDITFSTDDINLIGQWSNISFIFNKEKNKIIFMNMVHWENYYFQTWISNTIDLSTAGNITFAEKREDRIAFGNLSTRAPDIKYTFYNSNHMYMKISDSSNNIIDFAFVSHLATGTETQLFYGSYDYINNKYVYDNKWGNQKNGYLNYIDLNTKADWDIMTSRVHKNKLYLWSNYVMNRTSNTIEDLGIRNLIVIDFNKFFNDNFPYYNQDTYNLTNSSNNKDNNIVKIYKQLQSTDIFFGSTSLNGSPNVYNVSLVPTWDNNNILIFDNTEEKKTSSTSGNIFNLDLTTNNTNGSFAYETKWRNEQLKIITVNNLQNIYANKIGSNEINNHLKNNSNLLDMVSQINSNRYNINSTITESNNNNLFYKGQIVINLDITNGAYNGNTNNYQGEQLNKTFDNITIDGYHKYITELISQNIAWNNSDQSVYDINDDMILEFIRESKDKIFKDLPIDFNSNIDISNTIKKIINPLNRSIDVTFTLNRYVNENHELVETPKEFALSITDFKKQPETIVDNIDALDMSDVFSNTYYEQDNIDLNNQIKSKLNSKLNELQNANLPKDYQIGEIIVNNLSNEPIGTIGFRTTISKYYNSSGELIETPKEINFLVNGFKKFETTTIANALTTITFDKKDITIDQITDNELNQFVLEKLNEGKIFGGQFVNKKLGQFKIDDFTTTFTNKDPQNGTIDVEISLKNKYVYKNGIVSNDSLTTSFKIDGIGVLTTELISDTFAATTLIDSYNNQYSDDEMYNDDFIKNIIISKKDIIFENSPKTIDSNNIINLNVTKTPDKGIMNINFTLTNSSPIPNKNFAFTINGFKNKITTFINNVFDIGDPTYAPIRYNNNEALLKEDLIANNDISWLVQGLPNDYNIKSNLSVSNIVINQYRGSLTCDITLRNVYTNDSSKRITQNITITGYKKVQTTIKTREIDAGLNTQSASDFVNNFQVYSVKQILEKNKNTLFENLPDGYNIYDAEITNPSANDDLGHVSFNLKLNNVWTENGSLSTSITLTGFKTILANTVVNNNNESLINMSNIPSVNELRPSDFINNDVNLRSLKQAIIDKQIVSNPNGTLTIDDLDIVIIEGGANDEKGTLTIILKVLNNKALTNGLAVNVKEFNITLKGFISGSNVITPNDQNNNNDNSLWIYVGAGAGGFIIILLAIILIIVLIKKKKREEELKRKRMVISTPPTSNNKKLGPPTCQNLKLTSTSGTQNTQQKLVPPIQNTNKSSIPNSNNINKTQVVSPIPRAGTGNAIKPGLVKNGTIPPKPNQPTPPPIKVNTPPKSFAPKKASTSSIGNK